MGIRKVILKKPIQFGQEGAPITELAFRDEIVAGDLRGIPMREPMLFDDILKMAGRLCGQPEAVMNRLSMADLQEVAALVGSFTESGPATGPTSSPS